MFLLSKIVGFLLNPLLWIILLAIIGLITKKPDRKRKIFISSLVLFLFFSNSFIIIILVNRLQAKKVELTKNETFTAGILLGGFVSYDEKAQQAYFNGSCDRFIQTARLYNLGHIKKVVVTGGNAIFVKGSYSEADFVVQNLLDLGIPATDIVSERKAKNTVENASFTKSMLDSMQLQQPYLLITSATHIPRATNVFENAGMQVKPFPCAYSVLPGDAKFTWQSLIPSSQALDLWQVYLKELVGLMTTGRKKSVSP